MMTRGRGGVTIPSKIDDVIYEQPRTSVTKVLLVLYAEGDICTSVVTVVVTVARQLVHTVVTGSLSYSTLAMRMVMFDWDGMGWDRLWVLVSPPL